MKIRVVDGTLDASLVNWFDGDDEAKALTHSPSGQILCPACAKVGIRDLLTLTRASNRFSCPRRHLFASEAVR